MCVFLLMVVFALRLTFHVLSDVNNVVAKQFGLLFRYPEYTSATSPYDFAHWLCGVVLSAHTPVFLLYVCVCVCVCVASAGI